MCYWSFVVCLSKERCSSDNARYALGKCHLRKTFSILWMKLFKSYWSLFWLTSPGVLEAHQVKRLWVVGREWAPPKQGKHRNKLVGSVSFCLLQTTISYIHINNLKYYNLTSFLPFTHPPEKEASSIYKSVAGFVSTEFGISDDCFHLTT